MPLPEAPMLRRALGLPLLTLYGLGVIIGAGIYVLIGAVVAAAGAAAPLSFVLAGGVAALTGLSYAELAARFPEAAGAPVYVQHAFGSRRLSQATGLAVAAMVIVSAAAIARGSAGYAQAYLAVPDAAIAGLVTVGFTAIACLRVKESVGLAAVITAIEVGGLLLIIAAGAWAFERLPSRLPEIMPAEIGAWSGIAAGAFLAFFAFIGFENFANIAEEAKDPARNLPRAILLSLALSTMLYALVATVAILAVPVGALVASSAPLLLVAGESGLPVRDAFAAMALLAIANGVLIEIIVLGRLLFGMARRGWLPRALETVHPRTETPVRATLVAGVLILVLTVALDVTALARLTSAITLLVFALVNLSLWRIQSRAPGRVGVIRIPRLIPPVAAAASVLLGAAALLA